MSEYTLVLVCGNQISMQVDEREDPWTAYDRGRWGLIWCVCRTCRRRHGRAQRQPVAQVLRPRGAK